MAAGKEIRKKITSVKSTQKITGAMEMVAASKMRKAQERMLEARPYATQITDVIQRVSSSSIDYKHPFLEEREEKNVGYIVISTDRGLCGGLNFNLFKKTIESFNDKNSKNINIKTCIIGSKAAAFFNRLRDIDIVASEKNIGESVSTSDLIGIVKIMLDSFEENKIDKLYVVYNKFVNTMTQQPVVSQLLPIKQEENLEKKNSWEYLYEPSIESVLDILLKRYVESQVYQAVVENTACEQAARMVAMKAASDNAAVIIEDLQLAYNKARQAAITQELSEIVAGAEAV